MKDRTKWPVYISLVVSLLVVCISLIRDPTAWILGLTIALVIVNIVFLILSSSIKVLKPWALPVTSAILIEFGINLMVLARFRSFVDSLTFDVNVMGLGLAVVTFGFALASEVTLRRIERNIELVSAQLGDTVELPAETEGKAKLLEKLIVKPKPVQAAASVDTTGTISMVAPRSKEDAQKRLDQDARKAGYQRGELYQLPDGSWGIHWGGKYPL